MNKIGKEDVYKLGIVMIIFLIIVVIFSVYIYKKEKKDDLIIEENNTFTIVNNYNIFFFVNKNINNFINNTIENNTEAILNVLDTSYKQEKNINRTTLLNSIKFYNQNDIYQAELTKYLSINDKVEVYYTEGKIVNEGYEKTTIVQEKAYYLLFVDYENMTMSLSILNSPLDEKSFIKTKNKEKEIFFNNDNKIRQIDVIDYTSICSMYISDFIWKVYNELETAYSLITNFSSLENFKAYIFENNITSEIKSCNQSVNEDEKRVYQIVDINNNKNTFTEEKILDYRVSVNK